MLRIKFVFLLLVLPLAVSAQSVILEGPLIQGGLVKGSVKPGTEVIFAGQPVRVSSNGEFLIGFHRDESSNLSLELIYPAARW